MGALLHDYPELPLVGFVLVACLLWAGVRRVVVAIVVVAVVLVLGGAALGLGPVLCR